MLTLITSSGGVPLHVDDYYVRELASGLDELCFTITIWDDQYPMIQEESSIYEQSDGKGAYYLVKAIDAGGETASVKCQIDIDDWKSALVLDYESGSNTFPQIVTAVKPTGWAVNNESGITGARTIRLSAATPYDVLEHCRSTFSGATYRFDNVNKIVTLKNLKTGPNLGAFVTRDLNLKENNYKGKSTGFATRLYAYGKDDMSFASINGGLPYVDDHTYSDRVICSYWKDERYTIPQNLLADAKAKLAEMAIPQRSFDCDVIDLAKTNPEKYSEQDFVLFSFVGLIDQTRSGTKINHQIVELWRYPYMPQNNKVVLSTVAPRIQSQVTQIVQSITNTNSDWNQQQAASFDTLSAAILGANGGSVRLLDTNNDGEPDTLYIADDPEPSDAHMVWRFNYQGWAASQNGYNGPFVLGATFENGGTLFANVLKVLNIDASNISTGTLSADRIAANSIAVAKLTGTIGTNNWEINLTDGTFTIGNISADNINAGTLSADRIAANSIGVGKLTGSISAKGYPTDSNSWVLNLTDGTLTIGNVTADNITAGTLSANRIAANSIAVSKLTGTIGTDGWSLDLTNGTLTIGNISANNITGGTINAENINVTNINGANIKNGTIGSSPIASSAITSGKIATDAVTSGKIKDSAITSGKLDDLAVTSGKLNDLAVTEAKIGSLAVTNGKLGDSSVSYGKTSFQGTLTQVGTNTSDISGLTSRVASVEAGYFNSISTSSIAFGNYALYVDPTGIVRGSLIG